MVRSPWRFGVKGRQGATVERLELAAEAIRLRSGGMTAAAIADRLGISRSYAAELYTDPDGAKTRARKERYAGSCVVCGAATSGSNGKDDAPEYCADHATLHPAMQAHYEAIRKWHPERIIACIRAWVTKYGEPPAIPDWSPWASEHKLHDPARAERARKGIDAGEFPDYRNVFRVFGSWNAALEAAGCTTRAPHGGAGNQDRRRSRRAANSQKDAS